MKTIKLTIDGQQYDVSFSEAVLEKIKELEGEDEELVLTLRPKKNEEIDQ